MAAARVLTARLEHINVSVSHRLGRVHPMAASIPIEQESGISAGHVHSHNGYFAGVFASPRYASQDAWHALIPRPFDPEQ